MDRKMFIGAGGIAFAIALLYTVAHAQGIAQYIAGNTLTATRFEVEVPHVSFWSFLGAKVTGRLRPKEGTVLTVTSSAYAPSPYQTDSTPCITASGTTVRPGVVATNFLPLGTVVSIEGKEYIVEDRMNPRYDGYYMDIWFPSTSEALDFGRKKLEVTIVAYKEPGTAIRQTPTPRPATEDGRKSVLDTIVDATKLLFTATYRSNPNAYDVTCPQ